MVSFNISKCPKCGGHLKHYDSVGRTIRTKGGISNRITIRRLRCSKCNKLHREIPNKLYPYKQYEAEIIKGVLEGLITPYTIGYEDYPCEATIVRWKREKNMPLYEIKLTS